MNKENIKSQTTATVIKNLKLSKISMSEFHKAEIQAIEIYEKHHKASQPISYSTFCNYLNKWEKFGEYAFLIEIALPLFNLFEKDFWEGSNRYVFLNPFSGNVRSSGKWMKKFLTIYQKSNHIQQLILSVIFNDVFDVSLDFIINKISDNQNNDKFL